MSARSSRVNVNARNTARKMSANLAKSLRSSENIVILILLVILVVLVVYYVRQNNEGFSERPTVYFFHVDWCPHCRTAKPKVAEFKRKNKNVNVVEVDCEKEKDLAREFKVKAYPTVYLVRGEEKTELQEGISVNTLNNLVKNN
mgnify:CR=1 FL=1|jgi:thiol-disulfide isomerase/thioredoxin